jgi:hypothetical protein
MVDFAGEIRRRMELRDQAERESRAVQEARNDEYASYANDINAFNRKGINLNSAPFLEDEAKFALRGLLSTYKTHGVKPSWRNRGYTRNFGFEHLQFPIYGRGYWVARKFTERYGGMGGDTPHHSTQGIIVTPAAIIKSDELPPPNGRIYDGAIPVMRREQFGGVEQHYRKEFDTATIVDSVLTQLAQARLEWVEPE